jgi:predicted DCC family thiol-disulfide oxidoreductase YuxK
MTVVYDGACAFCTSSAVGLQRRFGPDRVTLLDLQAPGALEGLSSARGVTLPREAAMQRMHVVLPDGRVFAGAEAIARVLASVRGVGWLAFGYYVPGVRQAAEAAYRFVARHRYRLFGRRHRCEGGACTGQILQK